MHTLARNLNLPASFVEIRHAATHEALPSLAVLRNVAVRALDWLWTNYWSAVGVTAATEGTGAGDERVQLLRARLALKRWRQLRRDNPLKELKHGDSNPESREAFAIIKECVTICKDEEGKEALADAFLEEKALIPAGKKYVNICFSVSPGVLSSLLGGRRADANFWTYRKSPLMNGAIHLWRPLLEAIDPSINGFADHLLTSMLDIFTYSQKSLIALPTEVPSINDYSSEFVEAILTWLQNLTSAHTSSGSPVTFGSHSPGPADWDELAKQCVLRPTEWFVALSFFVSVDHILTSRFFLRRGIRFLRHLVSEHPSIAVKYGEIVEMAAAQVMPSAANPKAESTKSAMKGNVGCKKRAIEDVEEEIKAFEARFETMQRQRIEWEARLRNGDPPVPDRSVMEAETVGRWRKWSGEWVPRPIGVL